MRDSRNLLEVIKSVEQTFLTFKLKQSMIDFLTIFTSFKATDHFKTSPVTIPVFKYPFSQKQGCHLLYGIF